MPGSAKVVVILAGQIKTPPMSVLARQEVGGLLRVLQEGGKLFMPVSRPMPSIGKGCHELRVQDEDTTWRVIYRIDADSIVVAEVFAKKTPATPKRVIDICKQRLSHYGR